MNVHIVNVSGKRKVYNIEEVRDLLSKGKLSGKELSWIPGTDDWVKLSERNEFTNYSPPEIEDPITKVRLKNVISEEEAFKEFKEQKKGKKVYFSAFPFAWRRLWAKMIDVAIWRIGFELLMIFIVLESGLIIPYDTAPLLAYIGTFIVFLVFLIIIESIFLSIFQTTPGKLVFGIRVKAEDAKRIGFEKAFSRCFFCYAGGMWFLIGFPYLTFFPLYRTYKDISQEEIASWDFSARTNLLFKRIWFPRLLLGSLLGMTAFVGYMFARIMVMELFREDFFNGGF
jgi:uncharacterized RDD family membrane protein YckC